MLQGCGKLQAPGEEELRGSLESGAEKGKFTGGIPTALRLPFLKPATGAVCKVCLQNLELQGVRGQDPENTALGATVLGSPTAMPVLIMPHFKI
jgi:hypothetical protein